MSDALREMIRSEFGHVNQRLDAMCDLALERHEATTSRLVSIEADVKAERSAVTSNSIEIAKQGRDIRTLYGKIGSATKLWTLVVSAFTAGAVALAWVLKIIGVIKGE